jgi:hypothetical protein
MRAGESKGIDNHNLLVLFLFTHLLLHTTSSSSSYYYLSSSPSPYPTDPTVPLDLINVRLRISILFYLPDADEATLLHSAVDQPLLRGVRWLLACSTSSDVANMQEGASTLHTAVGGG